MQKTKQKYMYTYIKKRGKPIQEKQKILEKTNLKADQLK